MTDTTRDWLALAVSRKIAHEPRTATATAFDYEIVDAILDELMEPEVEVLDVQVPLSGGGTRGYKLATFRAILTAIKAGK